ncbi:MAG: ATP-binding protein [Armatimonadota bacterium]|nr:ATP-binding protein [bacterium]
MGSLPGLANDPAVTGKIIIKPESRGLSDARRQVRLLADDLELGEDDASDLLMAVGEAITNAYVHGARNQDGDLIYLGWHFDGSTLTITVKDDGPGFVRSDDSTDHWTLPLLGQGIELMRTAMDEVQLQTNNGGVVTLIKHAQKRAA